MIKKSFTLRILVLSFLLLALPLLIDSFIFFQKSYYEAINDAKSSLRAESTLRTFNLLDIKPVKQVLLKELIYLMDLGDHLENPNQLQLNRELAEIVHLGGEFQMSILKIEEAATLFKVIAASVESWVNTYFVSYEQVQQVIAHGEGTFIRYTYSPDAKRYLPYIYTARVIQSKETGKSIGLIMASAEIESQMRMLVERPPIQENIYFALLNQDGVVFAATDPKLIGQYFHPLSQEKRRAIIGATQLGLSHLAEESLPVIPSSDSSFFEFIYNDQVQIAFKTPSPINQISLMSYSAKEAFFGTAVRHFLLLYTIYGLILVVGGGVTYWLALWISRPLRRLTECMEQVAQGNLDARFKEEPLGFEINVLGGLFNQTLDNLLENMQHAEDERVKKETYERELSILREAQKSVLPQHPPSIKGAELAAIYLPAKDVGGDYYGFLPKKNSSGEDVVTISVADAAGRGFSSCLYALSARSLFRSYATLYDDVGEILRAANHDFLADAADTGMFMALFYAMYHVESKVLSYYSCGHIPGFVKRVDGEIISLACSGIAIGLQESKPYLPDTLQLISGDIVVLFTRALLEAVDNNKEQFQENRLKTLVQSKEWQSAQELVDNIHTTVEAFTQGVPQEEEIIVVILRVK